MKAMKKLFAIFLAAVMTMAMSVTAFADQEGELTGGSITINDAVEGQTYSIYQILYLESYNKEAGAYAYKATDAWSDFIDSTDIKGKYVKVDGQGYVTWVENASAADFAKLAQAYAKNNSIPNQGSTKADGTTVTFTGLELGYYLVDTTLGTLCSLNTTNPDVTIQEKNEEPTNDKEVKEGETWGYSNDANIGDTVNFRSTVTLPKGSENVVFHDQMSAGLTLDTSSIKVYTDASLTAELNPGYYDVTIPGTETNETDKCTFEVSFRKTYLDSLTATATVYVSYSATVNENAVVGGNGNLNESKLSYGDKDHQTVTPPDETKTYTWDVDVFKYAKNGDNETALAGAKFTLSKDREGKEPIALVAEDNNVYRVAKTGETDTVAEITTDDSGKFTIKGLDSGTYYLTETAAPAGYNKLAEPITIVIGENGVVNATTEAPQGVTEIKVLNKTGSELPETGGMGTTLFYVLGAVLVVGAGVLLVVRRRMSAEK